MEAFGGGVALSTRRVRADFEWHWRSLWAASDFARSWPKLKLRTLLHAQHWRVKALASGTPPRRGGGSGGHGCQLAFEPRGELLVPEGGVLAKARSAEVDALAVGFAPLGLQRVRVGTGEGDPVLGE